MRTVTLALCLLCILLMTSNASPIYGSDIRYNGIGGSCDYKPGAHLHEACETGLTCVNLICVERVHKYGESCKDKVKGKIKHSAICGAGLECKESKLQYICQYIPVYHGIGDSCGGTSPGSPVCEKDLLCFNKICRRVAELHRPCGDDPKQDAVCKGALECRLEGDGIGKGYSCQKPQY
ncbi:hypothetical protein BDR26DRAFT_1005139 [Obelidium mucronatum]|nr:hypothetical protein BDR26DRAFT_1005139 [Obelidium mucronatum]